MPLRIVRDDITSIFTHDIVCLAREELIFGTVTDARLDWLSEGKTFWSTRVDYGILDKENVFVVKGFVLFPMYENNKDFKEETFRKCYQVILHTAMDYGIRNISFPAICTDMSGCGKKEGIRIAIEEINSFLQNNAMEILLVLPYHNPRIIPYYAKWRYGYETRILESRLPYDDEDEVYEHNAYLPSEYDCIIDDIKVYAAGIKLDINKNAIADYIDKLIKDKGLKNADVYTKGNISKDTYFKIKAGKRNLRRDTALKLCVGAEMDLKETQNFLSMAGYALSPIDKRDIILGTFIESGCYDIYEIDKSLKKHGFKRIFSDETSLDGKYVTEHEGILENIELKISERVREGSKSSFRSLFEITIEP